MSLGVDFVTNKSLTYCSSVHSSYGCCYPVMGMDPSVPVTISLNGQFLLGVALVMVFCCVNKKATATTPKLYPSRRHTDHT